MQAEGKGEAKRGRRRGGEKKGKEEWNRRRGRKAGGMKGKEWEVEGRGKGTEGG